jgi:hypothetical protein
MSGNYLAGAVWPPVMQHFIDSAGWRATYFGLAIFCVLTMAPLALFLRRPAPVTAVQAGASAPVMKSARFLGRSDPAHPLGQTPRRLQMVRGRRGLLRGDVDARCTSWPIAPTLGLAPRRAPRCCR